MNMREWWSKLWRSAASRRGLADELSEEMQAHLDLLKDENLARGMTAREAEEAARRQFGNPTLTRERAGEAWLFPSLDSVLQDLRAGLRGIRKSPSFAAVVILTLALGIGATTTIFSVVYAVLLRPLPYPAGERLVLLGESSGQASDISVTWINYQHWRKENHSFEEMAGYRTVDMSLTGRGDARLTHAGAVTSQFFRLTGFRPVLGRLFAQTDDVPGSSAVAVLAYSFWAKTLGADPQIVGQTLALNGKPYQVVGVLSPGMEFFSRPVDYYVPLGPAEAQTTNRSRHGSTRLLALLKPGKSLAAARRDLDAIMQRLALSDPGPENDHRSYAGYLAESRTGDVRQTLWILTAAVGLLLVIACANVASLLLVRGAARSREMAIRGAIGAGRMRLARQLLTENFVLAALGAGLGLLPARFCLRALVAWGPRDIPRLSEVALDLPVLAFAAGLTLAAAFFAGLAPVLTIGRLDLSTALKDGAPASGRRGSSLRGALVIAEVALTLVLAFASGLLLRSLIAAQTADPGFDPDHVLALELQLPSAGYKNEGIQQFYGVLMQNLRAQPGVEEVGAVGCPPSAGDCGDWWYSIVGRPAPARSDVPMTLTNTADEHYFDAMKMPLVAGRAFTAADRSAGPGIAVVNEELARAWWPTPGLAVGRQIKLGGPYMDGPILQIVGVVRNVSQVGLDTAPLAEVYLPFSQRASEGMVVMIRTRQDPALLMPAVRKQVSALDRNLPVQSLRPFEEWMAAPLARRRFSTALLSGFAALAMILAAVGIYGVLNHWVGVRQKEIAVRMALGAPRSAIVGWAAAHALRLAGAGVLLGGAGAWAASRYLSSLVFAVSPSDPAMMLAAAGVVLLIAAIAATLPLWRATRVDAVTNLKDV
jgi:putative ABC transport system permease protein